MHAVTFEAVKEQLDILGHSVPDSVVRQFLHDMHQRGHKTDNLKNQSTSYHADGHHQQVPVLGDRNFCSASTPEQHELACESAKVLFFRWGQQHLFSACFQRLCCIIVPVSLSSVGTEPASCSDRFTCHDQPLKSRLALLCSLSFASSLVQAMNACL
jgi:hypothetical protein